MAVLMDGDGDSSIRSEADVDGHPSDADVDGHCRRVRREEPADASQTRKEMGFGASGEPPSGKTTVEDQKGFASQPCLAVWGVGKKIFCGQ